MVVKFNVVNLTKPDSLFAMGMRPVMYSHQEAAEKGLGWRRCGHDIDYRRCGFVSAVLSLLSLALRIYAKVVNPCPRCRF